MQDSVIPIFTGIGTGYLVYDCMHYLFHHGSQLAVPGYAALRKNHLRHHYKTPDAGFGISSPLFDFILYSRFEESLRGIART